MSGGDGDEDDARTVIHPQPGRRVGARPESAGAGEGVAAPVERFAARNPLVAAAGPLLALANVVRGTAHEGDVEGLRARAGAEIRAFEERAGGLELPRGTVRRARYCVAATIDDVAQNTPWGGHDVWARRSMVNIFDREAVGGERFYEVLDEAHREPGRQLWLLELIYLCLALGFEGRLRVERGGTAELERIRNGLFATIRNQRGAVERELSPRWRGLDIPHDPLGRRLPLWVVAAVTAGVLAFAYLGLNHLSNVRSDVAGAWLAEVPRLDPEAAREPVPLPDAATAAPAPSSAAPEAEPGPLTALKGFLEAEIEAGLVEVFAEGQTVVVRLRALDMFASASAEPSERARGILERVTAALAEEPGAVRIVGHTDDVPIRTVRFPSNWALSEARARAAAEVIRPRLDDPDRVAVEGRGAAEPIADNATAEGRARNRRIEILLHPKRPAGAVARGGGGAN
ncbi:MAG: type VI secretion system protein TssL [Alphaproteobacteria bacterium]|jgi:type VI secretion system protein ImpK|nr:type VI secretion system protein TssL [Alphaproteobacteria bacterium]